MVDETDLERRTVPTAQLSENAETAEHRSSLRRGRAAWRANRRRQGLPRNSSQLWRWPRWQSTWWNQPWETSWRADEPWSNRHVTWADGYPENRESGDIVPTEVAQEAADVAAEAADIIMSTALAKSPAAKRRPSRALTATSTDSMLVEQPPASRQEDRPVCQRKRERSQNNKTGVNDPELVGEQWDGNLLELNETGRDNRGAQYRRLNLVVDSGAFRSVIPPEVGMDYPTEAVSGNERPRARTATGE